MNRIDKLKEFLTVNPKDNFIRHALALEYIKLGEEKEARSLFESILEDDEQYIGSYYHLAKLLERANEIEEAVKWYEKGMQKSKESGDMHSYNELRAAYEDLVY